MISRVCDRCRTPMEEDTLRIKMNDFKVLVFSGSSTVHFCVPCLEKFIREYVAQQDAQTPKQTSESKPV